MGSWNETCGITNLPIRSGDRMVAVPLAVWIFYDSIPLPRATSVDCNPTGCYAPFYLPIKGEYDDYGGLEKIEDLEIVARHMVCVGLQSEGGELKLSGDGSLFEERFSQLMASTERLYLPTMPTMPTGKRLVDFMLMHESAFDFLVNKAGKRLIYKQQHTLRRAIEETLDGELKYWHKKHNYHNILFEESVALHAISYAFHAYQCFGKFYTEYCDGQFPQFKNAFTELMLLGYGLSLLRKGWLCQTSGRGSQGCELQLHKDLAEFVLEHIEHKQVEWRKENNGDLCLEEEVYF